MLQHQSNRDQYYRLQSLGYLLEELQSRGIEVVHHHLPNTHDGGKDDKGNTCQQKTVFHAAGGCIIQN